MKYLFIVVATLCVLNVYSDQPACQGFTSENECIAACNSVNPTVDDPLWGCQWINATAISVTEGITNTTLLQECSPTPINQSQEAPLIICNRLREDNEKLQDVTFEYTIAQNWGRDALTCPQVPVENQVNSSTMTCAVKKLETFDCSTKTDSLACIGSCNDLSGCQWVSCNYTSTVLNTSITSAGQCKNKDISTGDLQVECCNNIRATEQYEMKVDTDTAIIWDMEIRQESEMIGTPTCQYNATPGAQDSELCNVIKKDINAKSDGMRWYWWVLIAVVVVFVLLAGGFLFAKKVQGQGAGQYQDIDEESPIQNSSGLH